jgi:hypothetical protein
MAGLENLKDLSPLLFNDRTKSMNNTNVSNMSSEFNKLGYVDFLENTNRPGFIGFYREGSTTKYIPNSSKFDNLISFSKSDVTHIDTRFDDNMGQQYNVSFKQENSPVTTYDGIFDDITPFVNTNLIDSTFFNSSYDDGIGGLFNQVNKYSTVFRDINTPKGYGNSIHGNDIIEMGNIAPLSGDPAGGYQDRKDLAILYQNSKTTGAPPKYLSDGISENDIDMSGFWPVSGQPSAFIPFLNRFVEGSTDGTGASI